MARAKAKYRNTAIEANLSRAMKTRAARKKVYGDAHQRFGRVMMALMPEGVTLKTAADYARHGALNMVVSKITRYCTDPQKGHAESAHDLIVYAAMLEELT